MDIDLGFNIFRLDQKLKLSRINRHEYKSKAIDAKYKVLSFIRPGDEIVSMVRRRSMLRTQWYVDIYTNDEIWVNKLYHYKGKVVKVIDGDTIDVELDLGFSIFHKERFRLSGIDAWELRGEERDKGLLAKARVIELAPIGSDIIVKTFKDSKGKYGRYLGEIQLPVMGRSINQILLEEGHAKLYDM